MTKLARHSSYFRAGSATALSWATICLMLPPVISRPASAQTAPTVPAAKQHQQVEEIVVTAQKRSEKLSKVPISITALGRVQLDKQGVRDVKDIARLVPGLQLQTSNELGDTNISIRGISSDTGAETTGVYIDDTPVQARQLYLGSNPYPKVFDLDRVEVLRGPQGTLYGAGSEGGTVRFITPEPSLSQYTGYFRSELAFTDHGDPSYEMGGAVGGPIIDDKLGFRVSLWNREDGGYINRVDPVTGKETASDSNSANSTVARAALTMQVTDDLTVSPTIFYQRVRAEDRDYSWENAPAFTELAQIPEPHVDSYVLPALNVNYDFGTFSVKSISSYFTRSVRDVFDATSFELSGLLPGNAITLPGYPDYLARGVYHQTQNNWTQEIRFTSDDSAESRFSWVGGLYYQHNETSEFNVYQEPFDEVANYLSQFYGYGPGNSLSYFGEAPILGKYSYLQNIDVLETDYAAFGNLTYAITPTVKASVGLRVAHSSFSYSDLQDGPYGPGVPTTYGGAVSENPVTPRFALTWQLTPDQMLYATAAKGYRVGGANESVLGVVSCQSDLAQLHLTDVPHTYASDSVWSYEVGSKGSFFDHQLRIDASAFWINWSGIQQLVTLPDCGYYYTANLGDAVSRGFDIQAEWVVGGGLTVSGNAGLTDAYYSTTVTEATATLVRSGDPLPSPRWPSTAAMQEDFSLPRVDSAYGRVDYQFEDSYFRTPSPGTFSYNPNIYNAPVTNSVSIRGGVKQKGWDVSAFVDNLFNVRTSLYRYQDVYNSPGLRDIRFRPLTVGITAIKKF